MPRCFWRAFFRMSPPILKPRELLRLALLAPAKVELLSTTLLPYELTNGLWQAVRQGRLTPEDIEKILQKYELFEIPLYPVRPKAVIALGKLGLPIRLRFGVFSPGGRGEGSACNRG